LRKLERQDPTIATSYSDVVELILGKGARAVQFEGYGETSRSKTLRHQDWTSEEVRKCGRNEKKNVPRRVPNAPLLRRMPA
jgi:hypothetical protein